MSDASVGDAGGTPLTELFFVPVDRLPSQGETLLAPVGSAPRVALNGRTRDGRVVTVAPAELASFPAERADVRAEGSDVRVHLLTSGTVQVRATVQGADFPLSAVVEFEAVEHDDPRVARAPFLRAWTVQDEPYWRDVVDLPGFDRTVATLPITLEARVRARLEFEWNLGGRPMPFFTEVLPGDLRLEVSSGAARVTGRSTLAASAIGESEVSVTYVPQPSLQAVASVRFVAPVPVTSLLLATVYDRPGGAWLRMVVSSDRSLDEWPRMAEDIPLIRLRWNARASRLLVAQEYTAGDIYYREWVEPGDWQAALEPEAFVSLSGSDLTAVAPGVTELALAVGGLGARVHLASYLDESETVAVDVMRDEFSFELTGSARNCQVLPLVSLRGPTDEQPRLLGPLDWLDVSVGGDSFGDPYGPFFTLERGRLCGPSGPIIGTTSPHRGELTFTVFGASDRVPYTLTFSTL